MKCATPLGASEIRQRIAADKREPCSTADICNEHGVVGGDARGNCRARWLNLNGR